MQSACVKISTYFGSGFSRRLQPYHDAMAIFVHCLLRDFDSLVDLGRNAQRPEEALVSRPELTLYNEDSNIIGGNDVGKVNFQSTKGHNSSNSTWTYLQRLWFTIPELAAKPPLLGNSSVFVVAILALGVRVLVEIAVV